MPTAFLSLAVTIVFLFTPSAFAASYSASVEFDLASLRFSGIPVSFSAVIPPGTFDPLRNDVTVEQRDTFIFAGTSVSSHNILSPNWINGATVDHIADVGTVTALATPVKLSSSIDLRSSGIGSSLIARNGLLTATQAGVLTVSINYSIFHSAILVGDPDFFSVGRAGLSVGNFADVNQQRDFRDLRLSNISPLDAPLEQRGTASVTYSFNAGQSAPLEVFTTIRGSVPVPDMLWPTILGLLCIVGYSEGRQRRMRTQIQAALNEVRNPA
jgi:hypothetical protein